jgi:hypothetical protein
VGARARGTVCRCSARLASTAWRLRHRVDVIFFNQNSTTKIMKVQLHINIFTVSFVGARHCLPRCGRIRYIFYYFISKKRKSMQLQAFLHAQSCCLLFLTNHN